MISDLKYIDNSEGLGENETLHRIHVRADSLEKAPYALLNSVAALRALEEYVDFKYEMKSIDSAGAPGKTNAMENWGLILYNPYYMIYEKNPDDCPHTQLFVGVRVIAHEM
jgi:aminopeptidase N